MAKPNILPPQRDFASHYFDSGLGYARYYMTRNDRIWARLSNREKAFVKKQNEYWNNNNPGYKSPAEYQGQGGRSFFTEEDRGATWEGQRIREFLENEAPATILEIGPGSGYYTREIIEAKSLKEYIASDINRGFLETVRSGIENHPKKGELVARFVGINDLRFEDNKVDAIVLLSALHHVPDRKEFVSLLASQLRPGGCIFFYEPVHSLRRKFQLLKSFVLNRWFLRRVVLQRNNYMTHHFCSLAETQQVARSVGLSLESWQFSAGKTIGSGVSWFPMLAMEMVAVLRKPKS